MKSHVPIIPIALIDSYKVFNSFHFGPVTMQVHYLKPIEYDEYKDMKTKGYSYTGQGAYRGENQRNTWLESTLIII